MERARRTSSWMDFVRSWPSVRLRCAPHDWISNESITFAIWKVRTASICRVCRMSLPHGLRCCRNGSSSRQHCLDNVSIWCIKILGLLQSKCTTRCSWLRHERWLLLPGHIRYMHRHPRNCRHLMANPRKKQLG